MVEKPRALWMCGRAMFTMVMSRTTINWQEAITNRAMPLPPQPPRPRAAPAVRREAGGCDGWGGRGEVMPRRALTYEDPWAGQSTHRP
ncbi:sensor protein [Streptomyces laurentii]|uniref:Sensor protein n=1 Tax=Streptomyces laurentii TaxID=39478 RepID=A0A160P6M1_STRLU|nr:sensor protein [Streptomyces laurentii]